MRLYLAGRAVGRRIIVRGAVVAPDVVVAIGIANERWGNVGVMPWRAATQRHRTLALEKSGLPAEQTARPETAGA